MRTLLQSARRLICVPMMALLLTAAAAPAQELKPPVWPRTFEVFGAESASFGFGVTQPGAITVTVTAEGSPVVVTVSGPIAQPLRQQGSGKLVLTYTATAADVQKSVLWNVRISAVSPRSSFRSKGMPEEKSASGSVTVTEPPVNMRAVQAEHERMKAQAQQGPAAGRAKPMMDHLAMLKTEKVKAIAEAQAARKKTLLMQMENGRQGKMAVKPIPPPPPAKGRGVTSTSSADTGTGGAGGTGGTTTVAGSNSAQTVSMPRILSLSVNHGQPGDSVAITGSGFGPAKGQVHFIVNPGKDLNSTIIDYWSDTQILATVPDVSGIGAFAGQIYIQVSGGTKSPFQSFQFEPAFDYAQLLPARGDNDYHISTAGDGKFSDVPPNNVVVHSAALFWGFRGDDELYRSRTLKNGWVVDSVTFLEHWALSGIGSGSADATIADSRIGTNSPYVKVHCWAEAGAVIGYSISVTIKGPKGLPYQ